MSEPSKRRSNAKRRLFLGQEAPNEKDQGTAMSHSAATERHDGKQSNIVPETPQQKKQKVNQNFFSPRKGKGVIVTPDNAEREDDDEVQVVSPPLKRTRLSEKFSSREPKSKPDGPYVPTYIHKNLSYKREGTASLPAKVKTVFQLVVDHHRIPEDFEQNRSYGPLSGISYEERVIGAYNRCMLLPKDGNGPTVEICSSCATVGHKRNDCPDLI